MSRHCYKSFVVLSLIAACAMAIARAQESNNGKPEQLATSAIAPRVINIWPGVAPGSEKWKQKEATIHMGPMESIVNVTTPTLTAYLPDPAKATGTAVTIAPGGGFLFQGPNKDVAEWLAARGIAAFDLKYRTAQIEGETEAQLGQAGGARFGAQIRDYALIAEDGKYALDDGVQAIKVVRAHAAARWPHMLLWSYIGQANASLPMACSGATSAPQDLVPAATSACGSATISTVMQTHLPQHRSSLWTSWTRSTGSRTAPPTW